MSSIQGQLRRDKITQLQNHLAQQQSLIKSSTLQSDTAAYASYMISELLAKIIKPLNDGKIIKECLQAVGDVAFPDKKHVISKISLRRFIIGKRIEELTNNTDESLKMKPANFKWFSTAKVQSNDMSDTTQHNMLSSFT
jgi:hypothetical protein